LAAQTRCDVGNQQEEKDFQMRLSIRTLDKVVIVNVAGAVDSHAAGRLYDVLVERTGAGRTMLIVDLSGVHVMTRAGVRGLVVAAKLMQHARGEMRICGAQPSIEALLQNLGFHHLLKCDPTFQASLARLCDGESRIHPPAPVVPFGAPAPAHTPEPYLIGAGNTVDDAILWRRGA
jgi:anti-anti-sigma factor